MSDDSTTTTANPWHDPDRARRVRQAMNELGVDELSARQIVSRAEGKFSSDLIIE